VLSGHRPWTCAAFLPRQLTTDGKAAHQEVFSGSPIVYRKVLHAGKSDSHLFVAIRIQRIRTPNTPPFAAARLQPMPDPHVYRTGWTALITTGIAALIHRAVRPQALNIRSPFAPTNSPVDRASREEANAGFIRVRHHRRRFPSTPDYRLPVDQVRDEQQQ
jgi:hypothetical protein